MLIIVAFCWSSMAQSIDRTSVRNFGHWPFNDYHQIIAVMPTSNKKIIHEDASNEPKPPWPHHHKELMHASMAGAVAMAPHFMIGYYWWRLI